MAPAKRPSAGWSSAIYGPPCITRARWRAILSALHEDESIATAFRCGGAASSADGMRLVLPAFGAYAGGLDVRDKAVAGNCSTLVFQFLPWGRTRRPDFLPCPPRHSVHSGISPPPSSPSQLPNGGRNRVWTLMRRARDHPDRYRARASAARWKNPTERVRARCASAPAPPVRARDAAAQRGGPASTSPISGGSGTRRVKHQPQLRQVAGRIDAACQRRTARRRCQFSPRRCAALHPRPPAPDPAA